MTKILSVDDDAIIREMIVDILETKDYEIVSAIDGRAGIEAARQHLPDLIICDVEMPDMNGWAMLEEVRKCKELQETPFIFLTGLNSMQNLRQGMNLGADDYLTKPFTYHELIQAVETRLARHLTVTQKYTEELKDAGQKIENALYYDANTGLPNRKRLQESLISTLNTSEHQNLSVLSLSLDHFDQQTLSRPQAFANMILKQTGDRLKKIFKSEDSLLYLEHNHFLGFCPTDSDRLRLQSCLDKVLLAMSAPFQVMQHALTFTASIGIAIYPLNGQDLDATVLYAIEAQKQVQATGGNHYQYHD